MTKTLSVAETSRHFCNGIALQLTPSNAVMETIRILNKELPQLLTADRNALLTELKDSIQTIDFYGWNEQTQSKIKEKVQAHINNLINPSV